MGFFGDDARSIKQHFKVKILKNSILQKDRDSIDDANLSIEFSELPDNLTLQKSAVYNDESIPGRSEPWKTYSMSNSTMIDFSAKLVSQGVDNSSPHVKRAFLAAGSVGGQLANKAGVGADLGRFTTYAPRIGGTYQNFSSQFSGGKTNDSLSAIVWEEVHQKAALLESLTYPQYNKDGLAFPPPLVVLSYGANFARRGIVKDVRLQYQGPWVPETGLAMVIDCNVVIEEVNEVPKSHLQVRGSQKSGNGAAGQASVPDQIKNTVQTSARATFGL